MNRKNTQVVEALAPQPAATLEPLLVSVAEASRIAGCSVREGFRKLASGRWEAVKDGASTRVILQSVRQDIAALPRANYRSTGAAQAA